MIQENYLLNSELAQRLYHDHAASLPLIDYHSHLDAKDLSSDRRFSDLTELWIAPDQYKHRAMRMLGVPESDITGSASPRKKFHRWAETLPKTLGHPLFSWSAIELRTYFDITEPLNPASANRIWDQANHRLQQASHGARGLLLARNVESVRTSDRFLDDLSAHANLARSDFPVRVHPSLRGDDALAVEGDGFRDWIRSLGEATVTKIHSLESYQAALLCRLEIFAEHGCTLTDHGIDIFDYRPGRQAEAARAFSRLLAGERNSADDLASLHSFLLSFLAGEYARRGWAMQLHLGAQRQTSGRLRRALGPAGGYASIGGNLNVAALCTFFDDLESRGALPKTILYSLNPGDYPVLATLSGSFTEEGTPGKIQFGPAWWYNDHAFGIRQHLDTLSNYGLLSTFIGMTTDSRSLLSMVRHDYFRRILCDWFAERAGKGSMPNDVTFLGSYVRRIACANARDWLPAPSSLSP